MQAKRPVFRLTRRRFLIAFGALLAGCRPAAQNAPTPYVPGSAPIATPTAQPFARPTLQPTQTIPVSVRVTEANRLYIHSYRLNPDISNWALHIDGLVDHPLTLTMDDIRKLPSVQSMRTLECIGNPVGGGLIGNIIWTGAAFDKLLAQVGVQATCSHVLFGAADGYTTSVEMSWIEQPGVILAYLANGEPLRPEHGYPLRILIPGLYGQKMPKWITKIAFADHDTLGYWEGPNYGWSNRAVVKTNSQIVSPDEHAPFSDPLRIEGLAYAGQRAITKVEVSTNGVQSGANWKPATLIHPSDALAWTWWVYDWSPPGPGDYILAVRARDDHGFTQAERATGLMGDVFPDGTEAIHTVPLRIE